MNLRRRIKRFLTERIVLWLREVEQEGRRNEQAELMSRAKRCGSDLRLLGDFVSLELKMLRLEITFT